jgi:hypothetical protein
MSTTLSVWALLTLSTQQSQHLARTDAHKCLLEELEKVPRLCCVAVKR